MVLEVGVAVDMSFPPLRNGDPHHFLINRLMVGVDFPKETSAIHTLTSAPSIAQMANDPTLDLRHHDLFVDVIEEVVKVSVVQLQGLVL
jgi:hypothetical protein